MKLRDCAVKYKQKRKENDTDIQVEPEVEIEPEDSTVVEPEVEDSMVSTESGYFLKFIKWLVQWITKYLF